LTSTDLLGMARVAEQAERFEDMCQIMQVLVEKEKKDNDSKPEDQKMKNILSTEQRNMLSVAYKNVVGARRASWRTLKSDLQDSDDNVSAEVTELKKSYKQLVEQELENKCNEILKLLEDSLVELTLDDPNKKVKEVLEPIASWDWQDKETQVFYLKMCGDYYRYLSEFKNEKSEDSPQAKKAQARYEVALELADDALKPTHPTRLGLALNASVCYYEILKNKEEACSLAKQAFDDAIQKLDNLSDSNYKDSTLIMQLLRDNLTIWTATEDNTQRGNVENQVD